LLDVIEKLNPLLPVGKKLTLESLGIESFDGEPLSWSTYEKLVADVIIDFGTSFVVTPKKAVREQQQIGVMKSLEQEIRDESAPDVFDITSDVLKTEGVTEKLEIDRVTSQGNALAGGGKPSAIATDRPEAPVTPAMPQPGPPMGAPGPALSPPGGPAAPSGLVRSKLSEAAPATKGPIHSMPSIASPVPPSATEEVEKTEEKKRKAKDFKMAKPDVKGLPEATDADDEHEEFGEEVLTTGKKAAKTQYDKSISVDYFDVMNPENYYPVVVDIADIEQAWKPVEENIITGERKVQVKEKAVFETDSVTVRPVFPGCTVAPAELDADLTKPKEVLTFYVTPLVRGGIKGELHFLAKGKIVHKTELPAAVKDPRYGRMITLYGLIASMVPKLSTLFSIDLGAMLSVALGVSLTGEILTSIIAVGGTGIPAIFGMLYYATHRPKNAKLQLHVSDFRLSIVPPNVP